ncbi:unnamed protein product [Somion occarium]|uniref:Uncharacterized protein n=1 Tax=Somion occarium TaxID=3059160 RepID=A0ABP1DSK4_9APHY
MRPNHARAVRYLDIMDSLQAYGTRKLVIDLLPLLPALEGMRICNMDLLPLDPEALDTLTVLASLQYLRLERVSLASLSQLEAFILALPSLTRLSLERINFFTSAPEGSSYANVARHSHRPTLQAVEITNDNIIEAPTIHDWLSQSPIGANLTSPTHTDVDLAVGVKGRAVARLLHARGTLLRELTLSADFFVSLELYTGLQACPVLHQLDIRDITTEYYFGYINSALPHVQSHTSQISFGFESFMKDKESDEDKPWQTLDDILQSNPFRNLNEVTVSLRQCYPYNPATCLPRTLDRGILTFTAAA